MVGDTTSEKSGANVGLVLVLRVVAAWTLTVTSIMWVRGPLVPVSLNLNDPSEAPELPATISCEVALVPGLGVAGIGGVNDKPSGVGLSHEAMNETVELKPLIEPIEMVEAELPP